ncbi:MAG: DUF4282 domain-containing protein [Microbacterium sp.]|uniref:DUF4282 domain-containing protein n=1 Tax=Microbacterium sp. TaxID=51671 RepID=UPI0039E5FEBA
MTDNTSPEQPATPPQRTSGQPPLPPRPPLHAPDGHRPQIATGFFRALFDFSFRTFITRRLAGIFYLVGLAVIAIAFLVYFIGGIIAGVGALRYNSGGGALLIIGTIILVPVLTFVSILVLRFWIEAVVALVAVAENTRDTAENTRRR